MRARNQTPWTPRGQHSLFPLWLGFVLQSFLLATLLSLFGLSVVHSPQAYGASTRKSSRSKKRPRSLREGVIVKLEPKQQFLIDLGKKDRVQAGMKVSVYRRVKVKHPISGKTINDRFYIGTIKLEQVSRFLSVAKTVGGFSYKPSVGDFVVPGPKPITYRPGWSPSSRRSTFRFLVPKEPTTSTPNGCTNNGCSCEGRASRLVNKAGSTF